MIVLMSVCTLSLLSVQLYWNYKSFYTNKRIFKSQANDALSKSVSQLMDIRRDEFADQYKKWMLDTSLIKLSVKYDENKKANLFIMEDAKISNKTRPPFDVLMSSFKNRIDVLTPSLKKQLVDSFVKDFLYSDFATGRILFFTTSLGEMQSSAFSSDTLNLKRLENMYRKELLSSEIEASFSFNTAKYEFTKFSQQQKDSADINYHTKSYLYGFGHKVMVSAVFLDIDIANLKSMKWLLLSSFILMTIMVSCFAYTVNTMLSQKKLTELKDDFVNNMTHELKTPVATISIAAEAIQDFETNKVAVQEYLSIIRSQATGLTNLIEQILNHVQAEHTNLSLTPERVSFKEIVKYTLSQYQPQLKLNDAKVTTSFADEKLIITGDRNHLQQVIGNLLDNAIKYSIGNPEIQIFIQRDKHSMVFQISNKINEIPELYLNRLFEKFFRVPTGNLHQVKGYGLGLSYVAQIVRQHRGTVTVATKANVITFTLTLPLNEQT